MYKTMDIKKTTTRRTKIKIKEFIKITLSYHDQPKVKNVEFSQLAN